MRPDANTILNGFHEIVPPSGIHPIDTHVSWATYTDMLLETGGSTENMVVTADIDYWQQGIRAPTAKPTATLAGAGWTADLILYYSWYDERTDEDSALSIGSITYSAANQAITASNANQTPTNPRATHIRCWLSVDGSLPRLAATRQIGCGANILLPSSIGDLGQAFTEDFDLFPRCKYNVVWHDRQVMAGDEQNPNRIYFSLIGLPERRALFSMDTKTRQAVIGLFVVNDQLIVLCQFASERISGYTEDDLAIEIAQPQIGGICNRGVQVIHGYAWVPTMLGWYVTDGAAWYFMALEIDSVFVREYAIDPFTYEDMWSVHDPNTRVYVAGLGHFGVHSDLFGLYTRWVADYKPTIPLAGGGMGQPNWMYDTSNRPYACGAVLAVPHGRRQDVFFGGFQDGTIWKQDETDFTDFDDPNAKTFHFISATEYMGDCGGDLAHGKEVTEVNIYLKSEFDDWSFAIYGGDAEPFPQDPPSFESGTIAASFLELPGNFSDFHDMQPQWTHRFPVPQVVGQGFQVEIVVPAAHPDFEMAGYELEWHEGPYDRFATNTFGE